MLTRAKCLGVKTPCIWDEPLTELKLVYVFFRHVAMNPRAILGLQRTYHQIYHSLQVTTKT